jgi:hypothetical protein
MKPMIRAARAGAPLLVLAVLSLSRVAAADPHADELQCNSAYTEAQKLRAAARFRASREQVLVCSQEVCAGWIKTDCLKWLSELDAALPTVVFEVHGVSGAETSEVRVSLDGEPWLQRLEGKAIPVDPGEHTLRFEIAGAPPSEQKVLFREAEKGRKIVVSFEQKAAAAAPPPPTTGGVGDHEKHGVPAWAWVVGAGGLAAIGAGVAFAVEAASASSRLSSECTPNFDHCGDTLKDGGSKADVTSQKNTGLVLTGVLGGVGLLAVGMSIYGIASAPKSTPTAISLTVGPGHGGVLLKGAF